MTRTEKTLLDKLQTKPNGIAIETLADGRRKFHAALALAEKGLVRITKSDTELIPVRRGQGRSSYYQWVRTSMIKIALV